MPPHFPKAAAPLAIHLALAAVSPAGEGLFDWESGDPCAPKWEADGLRVTNARGTICASSSGPVTNGTRSSGDLGGLAIFHINGLPFTPRSMDLAEYSATFPEEIVSFFGTKADGTVVSTSVALDGVFDGAGGQDDFQPFAFPADFADIVRLEVPDSRWRFDHFRFATIIPPPLPPDPLLNSGFLSANLLYSKPVLDNTLVIGGDFQFVSGFIPNAPSKTKFLPPEGAGFFSNTLSAYYDRPEKTLYFKQSGFTALRKITTGPPADVVTLANVAAAGFPEVESLSMPRAAGGRLFFLGANFHGGDAFFILRLQAGAITGIVTPQTVLPDGKSGSTPHNFPNDIAVTATGFAFDTSVKSAPSTGRLYASFGGEPVRQVFPPKVPIPWQESTITVESFSDFEFTSGGALRVRARLATGNAWLHFTSAGLVRVMEIDAFAKPENAGKNVSGELVETAAGVTFLAARDEIYRLENGLFYRVAGVGDTIGGNTVSLIEFKAAPATPPLRAIVEVRYESSPATAHLFELVLAAPRTLPPRFGESVVHPESGDLFIPLSQLTLGHRYWLQRSGNLADWTDVRPIENVAPMQNLLVPKSSLVSPSFFRVMDR